MSIFSVKSALQNLEKARCSESFKQKIPAEGAAPTQKSLSATEALSRLGICFELITKDNDAIKTISFLDQYEGIFGFDIETVPLHQWTGHPNAGLYHFPKIKS